jgi:dihydroneopterin aldolase/2-amino-4-hydroxy-6-hydroxymethyldihydropteridine diphosphokinase
MDKIQIKGLKVFAHHGVYPEESAQGQDFFVSVCLETDTRPAGLQDDLTQSVDYGELCMFIDRYMKKHTFKLLETVTENLAREILLRYPKVSAAEVSVSKPHAPIPLPFEDVSVTIRRAWHEVFLGVGSNVGDKAEYIRKGLETLENEKDIFLLQTSTLIETEPYGGVEMDAVLNGVIKIKTLLTPYELLELCGRIEAEAGRERTVHWGPRTLDLDILFYDKLILEDEYLTIPHIDMKNRAFVLEPMAEIAPGLVHPVYGRTMADLLKKLKEKE